MSEINGKSILIIDDDADLLDLMTRVLGQRGAQVHTAPSAEEGLRRFHAHQPDLVLLDIMLPEIDGWQVCQQIRQRSDVPIIMLTALGQDQYQIRGLDSGADDYVSKPFSTEVLLARVRAALRRGTPAREEGPPPLYSDGYLTVDLEGMRVLVGGERVSLSRTEYGLLACLFRNAGRVLTLKQILDQVWGPDSADNVEYVHVYISHLRRKLEKDSRNPEYVLTEHGVGYRFEKRAP
jgi:two-component system KDP operon response regulator KdpE